MKKLIFLINILSYSCLPLSISYIPTKGRLGDQIINFAQSYWVYLKNQDKANFIAHNFNQFFGGFNMPFQPLPNKRRIQLDNESNIQNFIGQDIILLTHHYTKTDDIIEVGLQNPLFKKTMQDFFLIQQPMIKIPKGHISIAIHIRKGGGADSPLKTDLIKNGFKDIPQEAADVCQPLKFPPDEYYINQFRYLYNILKGQQLFVYIFTDNKDTNVFCSLFRNHFHDPLITFTSRKEGNSWNKNILLDLTNMAYFDCLIRPNSNYSKAAHLIGKHAVVIYPQSAYWKNEKLIVDKARALFYFKEKTIGINLKN